MDLVLPQVTGIVINCSPCCPLSNAARD